MGIAESLKYQKYKAGDFKGIPFWFTERLAQSSKGNLFSTYHPYIKRILEIGKIMPSPVPKDVYLLECETNFANKVKDLEAVRVSGLYKWA